MIFSDGTEEKVTLLGIDTFADPVVAIVDVELAATVPVGNSGAPRLNPLSEVVGVDTAVVRRAEPGAITEGLRFAIPGSTVKDINSDHPLEHLLFHYNVGDDENVEVYRASTGKTMTFEIMLATTPDHT